VNSRECDSGSSEVILNLGCGVRTSPSCVNIDWSNYLRVKKSRIASLLAPLILRGSPTRLERFRGLDDSVVVHDLRRGIPFEDASVDAVYHSHFLEHLDRPMAQQFVKEIHRVLRPGGIHRIVVPDMEWLCRRYLDHLARCVDEQTGYAEHDEYLVEMIQQMVQREGAGTSQQRPLRRAIENVILGDARQRGETHQWMYDRVNLRPLLENAGFRELRIVDFRTSSIPNWNSIGLDRNEHGDEYIPGSLYVEAPR
jgi:predicted SAM-dependent methyltransferase